MASEDKPKMTKKSKQSKAHVKQAADDMFVFAGPTSEGAEEVKKEKEAQTTKRSRPYEAYAIYKADNQVVCVKPDEVHYISFDRDLPCLAATNLNGAFVVIMVSDRAGLMAHIAPTRESLEKFSDFRDPHDKKKSIQHVREVMNEMRTQCLDHQVDFDRKGTYVIVVYAKFQHTTPAGARPLDQELEHIKLFLPPRTPVRTVSYIVDRRRKGDSAPMVWLDSRSEPGRDGASPVLWMSHGILEQHVHSAEETDGGNGSN